METAVATIKVLYRKIPWDVKYWVVAYIFIKYGTLGTDLGIGAFLGIYIGYIAGSTKQHRNT